MSWLTQIFSRRRVYGDLSDEMRSHVEEKIEELVARGMPRKDAAYAARREFGNFTRIEEDARSPWRWPSLEDFVADIRHALRSLRKSPAFTLAAVLTLALGIGANTAIFTVVNTVLLRSLPYPDADRIVNISRPVVGVSMPLFTFWERNNPGFEDLCAYQSSISLNVETGDSAELIQATKASRTYFRLLGGNPILGRTFTAEEDRPGGLQVAVISFGLWQRLLGADQSILGKTIRLGGAGYSVIGILSPSFTPNPPSDVWIPLQADPNSTNQAHVLTVSARLPKGTTLAQANSQIAVLAKRYVQEHPEQLGGDENVQVSPMRQRITQGVRSPLFILLGAVGFVLLIACANVANLLLARATNRQREIAIRFALGASRWRIIRQLLCETLLLSLGGAMLGLLLGSWGVRELLLLAPDSAPRIQEVTTFAALDPWVLGFALTLAVVTGVLFGLFPAAQLSHVELSSAFKSSGGSAVSGAQHQRTRQTLAAAEVAIAVALLCGAVLLIRSFAAMHSVSLGFDPRNLLTMEVSLSGPGYAKSADVNRIARTFLERVERVPGVESAAWANSLPLRGTQDMIFDLPGHQRLEGYKFTDDVQWRFVSAHYFETLRIPLLSGRFLRDQETAKTVVINEAMAHKYWPGSDAVGQHIIVGPGLGPEFEEGMTEIVGVVGDVREHLDADCPPTMYQTPPQIPDAAMVLINGLQSDAVVVRTQRGVAPMSLSAQVKEALLAGDKLPATRVGTMDDVLWKSTQQKNFNLSLLGLFASIALLLAGIGIYGVMSYGVAQRTREIGLRTALGASRGEILRVVLSEALRMAVVGVAFGIVTAFGLTRFLSAQLFSVKPTDPLTFVTVPVILVAVALMAAWVPARRAVRVDPMVALRHE